MTDDAMPEVIDFLLGEGTLDGWGYGEKPDKTGAFWWRKHLRDYNDTVTAGMEAAERMATKLDQVARWLRSQEARSVAEAKTYVGRFDSLADACNADAKNYGATAKDVEKALQEWRRVCGVNPITPDMWRGEAKMHGKHKVEIEEE